MDAVVTAWGKVDILVNNAAEQHVVPSITDCDPATLEHTFRVNLFPMFYLAKHAVPHMVRGSSIINTTSVVAYAGSPSLIEYSSTKSAIVGFTRSLAKQLAPKDIRVNGVAPGPVSASAANVLPSWASNLMGRGGISLCVCRFGRRCRWRPGAPRRRADSRPRRWGAMARSVGPLLTASLFLHAKIVSPLNPATRSQDNLEGWMAKDTPLGRIGQVGGRSSGRVSGPTYLLNRNFCTGSSLYLLRCPQNRLSSLTPPLPASPAQPSECGPAYVFLASQEASFMTGQVLHVDGGMFVCS